MPVASEEDKGRLLLPDHEILRVAECVRGEIEMRCAPRPDYGRRPGRIRHAGRLGVRVGASIGFVHAAVVLIVGMRLLPGLHPRRASEQQGPTVTRQLEPPVSSRSITATRRRSRCSSRTWCTE
ncbi:hypothetical protein BH24ACI5_BH24ACI5_28900 [soil metagenome]